MVKTEDSRNKVSPDKKLTLGLAYMHSETKGMKEISKSSANTGRQTELYMSSGYSELNVQTVSYFILFSSCSEN